MNFKDEEAELRVLVAAYRCFPNFSATAMTLNNLLQALRGEEYVLAGQRFSSPREPSVGADVSYPEPHFIGTVGRRTALHRKMQAVVPVVRIPHIARRLERLCSRLGCRQVMGVYPNIAFLGGAAIAAKRLGLPFYAWLHNTPHAMQGNRFYNQQLGLERKILSSARCIFAMSDAMRDEYRELYPQLKVKTLPHPFVINDERPSEPDYSERPIRLLFSGGVNESNANALGNIIRATRDYPNRYELHLCSRQDKVTLRKRFGALGNIHCHGFVNDTKLIELSRKAHVFLLPHGLYGNIADIEYRTIFPTKTITYMLANRPIFAHIPLRSGIDRYLTKNQVAYVEHDSDPTRLRRGLDEIVSNQGLRIKLAQNCVQALKRFDAAFVAQSFRKQIIENT